jgi:PKD repeat protein
VQFKGSATTESAITWWSWDFGDGGKSTIQNPSHTYFNQGVFLVQLTVTDDCGTATVTHTIDSEEKPEEPEPGVESGNLLINKPINKVTKVECTRAYNAEIFVDNVKVSSKAPFTIAFGTDKYVSGYGGQCGTHTIKVRLDGYQDVEQSWTINNGDDESWTPEMYVTGYVPPIKKFTINFYIPEGAVLGEPVKITTVSRIVAGMKRIGGR